MKVVDERKGNKGAKFIELYIGQTYLDIKGNLSIKTNFNTKDNCITFCNNVWSVHTESFFDEVTPIEATLTIK
jgi:hypothetical protein